MVRQSYSWSPLWIVVVVALALAACGTPTATTTMPETSLNDRQTGDNHHHGEAFNLPHIHGLGFTSDGKQLLIPAHIGIFSVSDGRWQRPSGPQHDYMGFSISDDGFYSSGHPAPSATNLPNPLGLVKSTDGGTTLQTLGFAGESDFHLMAVGYKNHAIYVLNPAQNSKLPPGMHYSLDDGKTWKPSTFQGVTTAPFALAVHPTKADVVALATEQGVLVSADYGATFERVGVAKPVTAVAFTPNGTLLFGATELWSYDGATKGMTELPAPPLVEDEVITAIAANSVHPQALALATTKGNIYLSKNNGQEWRVLASDGVGVNVQDNH
jgi:hypothetical protein